MTSRRASAFVVLLSVTALVLAGLGQRSADADHQTVTEVEGSAFGCFAETAFFGQPQPDVGPLPNVELPPGGSADPITATAAECVVPTFEGGPNVISTGPLSVSTQGTTGPTGSVTSTATISDINRSGDEAFTATSVSSTCTADEAGVSGSTTITGGTLVTDQTTDPDTVVDVPENPAPNTVIPVNLGPATANYIFNEQIINPDGSITVRALRIEPTSGPLTGTVIIGEVTCGVTTQALETTTTTTTVPEETTTTTVPEETTTTVPEETTTTTVPEETTTTTVPEETTTTTVPEETTTTTVPEETTTTTVPEETTTTTVPEETTTTTVPEETTTTTVPQETTTTTVPQETTTTTVPQETTTTTVPQETTTTTTVGAACVPFEDNARPGYGHGDPNHRHCGPPGQTGDRPPGKPQQGVDGRPVASSRNLPPAWLVAGLALLFLAPLVVPFGRARRGDRRA